MSVLAENMMNSARSGHALGAVLDMWINDPDHADTIPVACAEFKRASEQWIVDTVLDQAETRAFRKACNNTINEVSRQYRKVHGRSVKCVGRKGGYRYEVCDYTPRPSAAGVSKTGDTPVSLSYKDAVQQHPLTIMEAFVEVYSLQDIKGFLKHAIDVAGNS